MVAGCGSGSSDDQRAPDANAGSDQTVEERTEVTLDGSASSDSDGTIVAYTWSQIAGVPSVDIAAANSAQATFQAPDVTENTIFEFQLLVEDDGGATDTDTIAVTVVPVSNMPPTASISVPAVAEERSTINLDGSLSSDEDGAVTFLWTVVRSGDVPVRLHAATEAVARLAIGEATEEATVEVALQVTDGDGLEDVETATVQIEEIDVALLPPDPGRVSLDTLEGIDVNGDGVRDEVERALYALNEDSFNNRVILNSGARALQEALVASTTSDDRDDDAASASIAHFVTCLMAHSDMNVTREIATVEALMLNTDDRVAAYRAYSAGRHGTVQGILTVTAEDCSLSSNGG